MYLGPSLSKSILKGRYSADCMTKKTHTVDFQLEGTIFFMRALRLQVEYMYEKRRFFYVKIYGNIVSNINI